MIETFRKLFARLRKVRHRRALDNDIQDEIRFHLEMREAQLRQEGVSNPAQFARTRFGNVTRIREDCRSTWTFAPAERCLADLRYAARALCRKPGFTIAAVFTLAIGIGANSAVFSAVDAVLLRPLQFPLADQLMLLEQYNPKSLNSYQPVAPVRLEEWNRMNSSFQSITGYYTEDISETSGIEPEKLTRAWVAPRFFETWGIFPATGRTFSPQEERFRGRNVVIITDRFWRRRFNRDPNAVGQSLRIEGLPYTIIGVMPAKFEFSNHDVDLWCASPADAPYAQSRDSTWFTAIGRLKPGVTVNQARSDLSQVQQELGAQFPKPDADLAVRIRPLKDVTVGDSGRSLWLLFASVSLLLLIACINIAALMLARARDQEPEMSIRLSLGASRFSVMARLLAEVFLLALAGSACGLSLAVAAFGVLRNLASNLPRVDEIHLNWTLVVYSLACAVGATVICGLIPALRIRRSVAGSLVRGSRTLVSSRQSLPWLLAGVQVALSVSLLVGAGLMLRSFQELSRVEPGFEPDQVLTLRVSANWGETTDLKLLDRRVDAILDELRATPGVLAAATSLTTPGVASLHPGEFRIVEGDPDANRKIVAYSRMVSAGYFDTMQIPLLSGEGCRESLTPMIVVNRRFVDTYLPGRAVIGMHVDSVPANAYLGLGEIRGIVADSREEGLSSEPAPTLYWCFSAPIPGPMYLIRTSSNPAAMVPAIRAAIHRAAPSRSVYGILPLRDRMDESFSENRLRTVLLTFFAGTAVSLACLGIYGTLSYFVTMRRREVGLRIALGAMRREIVWHFLRLGMRVALLGCAAGLALSLAFGQTLSGLLYGVTSMDPITFGSVIVLVLLTGSLASLVPSVRASRVEPIQVLREQ